MTSASASRFAIAVALLCAVATSCAWNRPSRVPERDEPVTNRDEPDAGIPVHEAPPPRYGDRVATVRDGAPD